MKILYITPPWYGFREILFGGEEDIKGLPSFTLPLKGLIDSGHKVDIFLVHTERDLPPFNIRVKWLSEQSVVDTVHYDLEIPWKLFSIINLRHKLRRLIDEKHYDFVYAHGVSTAVGRSVVVNRGIPFGQRLYGTFLWDKIRSVGILKAAIIRAVEFFSFTTRKSFLLVTNDGSRGDLVVKRIYGNSSPPYSFHYWLNGVQRPTYDFRDMSDVEPPEIFYPYIFYCARFDKWKRQDRIVSIVHKLKLRGVRVNAYFAGSFDTCSGGYFESIRDMASDFGILDQMFFLGTINKKSIYYHHKNALASLSLYDVCNLGNSLLEMMAGGALIIVKNDGSTGDLIIDKHNGFFVDSNEQVVEILCSLLDSPVYSDSIRERAINESNRNILDWDSRVLNEISLINRFVN